MPSGLEMRVNSRLEEQRSGTQLLRAVLSTTLNDQRTWVSEYDGATRTARLRTPLGRGGESGLDELGRLSWSRSPTGTEVRYQYRPDNRLQQLTEVSRSGQQRVWQFGYDRYGHLTQVTDPHGRVSSVERDPMGQVLRSHDPAGRTTDYQYNKNGDVTALTPPERPAHQFEYDSQGRMTRYRPPLLSGTSTHRQWRFDRDGRLVQAQEQSGEQLSQSYDAFSGHPTVSQAQPGERSESQFDDAGRLSRLSYAPGTVEHSQLDFSYDGGLLLAVHSSGVSQGSVTYHYDADLRLSDYQINQQRIPLQYDLDGLLTQHGPLTLQRALPTGVLQGTQLEALSTQLSYDDFDQLQQYQAQFNQSELYRYQLQRDELGRIIGKRETLLGETHEYQYRYDEAQRLIEVQRDGQRLQQWSYDANNNRQSAEWQHDSHDRLLHSPALARPLPSGTRSYRTDALGRRVQTLHNGAVESTLLYSTGLLPIAKLDAQQQLEQLYLYAERANSPSVILQRTAHGFTPYRVITDHLGSPRLIVNAQTGDITQQLDYDVWGQVLHDTQPGFQPFGFAGGLYDPQTGLVRFGARDYDPYAGRWLAKDPIGFGGGDGNLYAYVGNDPVNWIDPDGLQATLLLGGATSSGALVTPAGLVGAAGLAGCAIGTAISDTYGEQISDWIWDTVHGDDPTVGPMFNGKAKNKDKENNASENDESKDDNYKKPASGSGKEKADNPPSWVKQLGIIPRKNESGKEIAKRIFDEEFGPGNYEKGPNSEFNKTKKYFDRSFE